VGAFRAALLLLGALLDVAHEPSGETLADRLGQPVKEYVDGGGILAPPDRRLVQLLALERVIARDAEPGELVGGLDGLD
jgi:hypothetical protein